MTKIITALVFMLATSGCSTMHQAAKIGNIEAIRHSVALGQSANSQNWKGQNILFIAAENNNSRLIDEFVRLGADINQIDNKNKTPLIIAIENNNFDATNALINQGANINYKNEKNGVRPIFIAIENSNFAIIDLLLKNNADPLVKNDNGEGLLVYALKGDLSGSNFPQIMDTLISAIENKKIISQLVNQTDINNYTPIHYAIISNNAKAISKLLSLKADLNINASKIVNFVPLVAKNNDLLSDIKTNASSFLKDSLLGALLSPQSSSTQENNTEQHYSESNWSPLQSYLSNCNSDYSQLSDILNNGASLAHRSNDDRNALDIIMSCGQDSKSLYVEKLLSHMRKKIPAKQYASIINKYNSSGSTYLISTIHRNLNDTAFVLLRNNASISQPDSTGYQPIYHAVALNNIKITKELIKKGALKNSSPLNHKDIVNAAVRNNNLAMIDLLFSSGINPNGQYFISSLAPNSNKPLNLLIFAAHEKNTKLAEVALKNRIPVDTMANNSTPLFIAASTGNDNLVQLLLSNRANPNLKLKAFKNSTALHAAAENGHDTTYKLLKNNGANEFAINDLKQSPKVVYENVVAYRIEQARIKAEQEQIRLEQQRIAAAEERARKDRQTELLLRGFAEITSTLSEVSQQRSAQEIRNRALTNTLNQQSYNSQNSQSQNIINYPTANYDEVNTRTQSTNVKSYSLNSDFNNSAAMSRAVKSATTHSNITPRSSTLSDPMTCISRPSTRFNNNCGKGLIAEITNSCPQTVDARICLMTPRGWDCGVKWGIAPGGKFSYPACFATGEVFTSAKNAGSNQQLAKP